MRVAFNSPARNQFSGESFNGRTAGLQPANEGSIPSSSTSSPGRPLRSRRRSEKPDKRVRLVPLAPSVTVAEWLRRQTVDLSTRVQLPPVTPVVRASFDGEDTSVLTKKCRFDSGRLFQRLVGVAQLDVSAGVRSPRPLVRFQPLTPDP